MESERGAWPLAGTVKPYGRHVFVCTGHRSWPPRLEEAEGLLGRMAADVRALRDSVDPPPKLTATDEPTEGPGYDLLVFPDCVRFRNVDAPAWTTALAELAAPRRGAGAGSDGGIEPLHREPLAPGHHLFVCIHAARDERCGCHGPAVLEALKTACAERGVSAAVRATSHVGGHKYAGNVLVYPDGVWYGYVRSADAPRIVDEHLRKGRIVEELCRGRMATA